MLHIFFFFFQAEDGIRDYKVTGVQTCALPIYRAGCPGSPRPRTRSRSRRLPTSSLSGGLLPGLGGGKGTSSHELRGEWGVVPDGETRGPGPHRCVPLPTPHSVVQPHSTVPPLTFRTSPVMCRARSEHKNTIGPAISSGGATRPSGIVRSISRFPFPASRENGCWHISVSTHPGATQFTAIRGASSPASDFVRAMAAPLVAA